MRFETLEQVAPQSTTETRARPVVLPEPKHRSVSERQQLGRAMRKTLPRMAHASGRTSGQRRSPLDVLQEQATSRLPDLVPVRYGRMLTSPFAFFRGSAAIMAMDLATLPRTQLTVQLCGDAHLMNVGMFGSPERQLLFDINDFDETLPGPFEWDIKRLCMRHIADHVHDHFHLTLSIRHRRGGHLDRNSGAIFVAHIAVTGYG